MRTVEAIVDDGRVVVGQRRLCHGGLLCDEPLQGRDVRQAFDTQLPCPLYALIGPHQPRNTCEYEVALPAGC